MRINLFNNGLGYVTDEVSTVDITKHNSDNPITEEDIWKYVTDIAAISRGNTASKNPKVRFEALCKEAVGNTPGRPLEFLPINYTVFKSCILKNYSTFRFSYLEDIDKDQVSVFTNYRSFKKDNRLDTNYFPSIQQLVDGTNYRVVKICVPMFVWSQIMTHTQLSKISQSDRVSENTHYWLPDTFIERLKASSISTISIQNLLATKEDGDHELAMAILNLRDIANNSNMSDVNKHNELVSKLLHNYSQSLIQKLFKFLDYPREIYSRSMYYFKYKECILGGYINDPYSWKNFLLERGVFPELNKNWVQEETKQTAIAINKILKLEIKE